VGEERGGEEGVVIEKYVLSIPAASLSATFKVIR
jgi:hypothetical protein